MSFGQGQRTLNNHIRFIKPQYYYLLINYMYEFYSYRFVNRKKNKGVPPKKFKKW